MNGECKGKIHLFFIPARIIRGINFLSLCKKRKIP